MALLFMKKFEQLKRQHQSLCSYLNLNDLSNRNISATTADFDRLFELSWKTLKTYLFETLGILDAKTGSPRDILKLAARENLISDDAIWLAMLKDRNDDAHLYHKTDAILYISKIADCYLPAIEKLISALKECIPEETIEEYDIPSDMIIYAQQHKEPLYLLVRRLKEEYGCETDNEVFQIWSQKHK